MDITSLAHRWISAFVMEGALAIDATAGNGHDTVFLARQTGATGKVFGFDIQKSAIDSTRRRLENEGLSDRVRLIRRTHLEMKEALEEAGENRNPRAIMFNLGYLPGGDKTVTTRTEATLAALDAAIGLLEEGGGITVVIYPGHPEGEREAGTVLEWAEQLPGSFEATCCRGINRGPKAPALIAIEKRAFC